MKILVILAALLAVGTAGCVKVTPCRCAACNAADPPKCAAKCPAECPAMTPDNANGNGK